MGEKSRLLSVALVAFGIAFLLVYPLMMCGRPAGPGSRTSTSTSR